MPNLPELPDIDWTAALRDVDWDAAAAAQQQGPGEFAQFLFIEALKGSAPHQSLADLFLTRSPQEVQRLFRDGRKSLNKLAVKSVIMLLGKQAQAEKVKDILDALIADGKGLQWIGEACAAARVLAQRAKEAQAQIGNDDDDEPTGGDSLAELAESVV